MYEACRFLPSLVKNGSIHERKEQLATIRSRYQCLLTITDVSMYEAMIIEHLFEICQDVTNVAMCTLRQRHRNQLKREKAKRQCMRAKEDRILWTQCGIDFTRV